MTSQRHVLRSARLPRTIGSLNSDEKHILQSKPLCSVIACRDEATKGKTRVISKSPWKMALLNGERNEASFEYEKVVGQGGTWIQPRGSKQIYWGCSLRLHCWCDQGGSRKPRAGYSNNSWKGRWVDLPCCNIKCAECNLPFALRCSETRHFWSNPGSWAFWEDQQAGV